MTLTGLVRHSTDAGQRLWEPRHSGKRARRSLQDQSHLNDALVATVADGRRFVRQGMVLTISPYPKHFSSGLGFRRSLAMSAASVPRRYSKKRRDCRGCGYDYGTLPLSRPHLAGHGSLPNEPCSVRFVLSKFAQYDLIFMDTYDRAQLSTLLARLRETPHRLIVVTGP